MKKITLLIILAAAVAASAAETPLWARVYYTDTAAMERDILAPGLDVCSGRAGEYVDLVATAAELTALQELGYRIKILGADAYKTIKDLPPDMGLYHTYAEMLTELQGLASTYPTLCTLTDVGNTWEARDMWLLKISDNPGTTEPEKKIFIVADHHAREIMTVEIALHFSKKLLQEYTTNNDIKWYVDNFEIYVMPMANPDGHVYVEGHSTSSPSNWWRKNRRDSGGGVYGVDLNRNYGYKWGYDNLGSSGSPSSSTYRGPSAFSEPETTAIRNLMIATPFDYCIDYHSYGEYILFPYGYASATIAPNPERTYFETMGNGMNSTLGNRFDVGTPPEVLYAVNGGSIDYHYGEQVEKNKFYGVCIEVNTTAQGGFGPNESYIAPTCAEQEGPFFWLLNHVRTLSVNLTSFTAAARGGGAMVSWETANENNHAGFNLFRVEAGAADSARVKLNDGLIKGMSPYRFRDDGVTAGKTYEYYLEDVDLKGMPTMHGPARLDMGAGRPSSFALAQSYPNPARGTATIAFTLPAAAEATLTIYDLAGRVVSTPQVKTAAAGDNAMDVDVSALAPGVYIYRLDAAGATAAKRMVITK